MSWFTRLLDLDSWRDSALAEIAKAKEDALKEIGTRTGFMLAEVSMMDSERISERLERVLMDSAYIIQIPEDTTPLDADRLRAAVEGLGAHCVVVSADTMKVVTLSARLDNRN